jgi:hypothetical protein
MFCTQSAEKDRKSSEKESYVISLFTETLLTTGRRSRFSDSHETGN